MKMKSISSAIESILESTDEVTIRDLLAVVNKLSEDGFTEETIIDELYDLKNKLRNLNV